LFEDCCKAVFATNTTFDRTIAMTESFIELCGSDAGGHRVFPGPEQVYRKKEHTLQKKTGCGYRATYILKLAKAARNNPRLFSADGCKTLSGVQFYDELKKVPGLGPASLNYLAMIYGKPAGFTIDAYVQRRCRDLWGVDKAGIKGFLQERYRDVNGYGPLLLWFELTGHWHMRESDSANRTW
jgi:3-methyladenine DNA glycosylase/8-oxoguanine DNA glycosylase